MQSKILLLCVLAAASLSAVLADDVDCSKHPQRIDPKSCCPMPEFVSDEIKQKCAEFEPMPEAEESSNESYDSTENPQPGRPRPPHHHHHHKHHHHPCHAECIFNETGIVEDNKLNEENLKTYLSSVLAATPDMIPVVEAAFKTCAAKGEEFKAKWQQSMKDGTRPTPPPEVVERMKNQRCRPSSSWMMMCTFKETFKNCAPSLWSDTEQCNQKRAYMQSCKPKFGLHGPKQEDSVED